MGLWSRGPNIAVTDGVAKAQTQQATPMLIVIAVWMSAF